ncbi:PhzF family phenazine biosynthesis protein [Streptomyces sp. NPDC016845]|uniref:PhzF family phenazine biosynthesis protein n=1 Tax=Streptomyces sp. NPDC016845 TaxID=3364972 RepID=UPI003799B747
MIHYELVSMFTATPYAGSPLAVVPHATTLSEQDMLAAATAIGADESVFVLPASAPEATYRVRVFTPLGESAGGGHSCVGTAATLVRIGLVPPGRLVQECGTARHILDAQADRATFTASGHPADHPLAAGALLAAVGLTRKDQAGEPHATGFGTPFAFLPVRPEALATARPDFPRMTDDGLPALCLLHWSPTARTARTRLFAPGFGIAEDPACAPVAGALGLWLAHTGLLPARDGTHPYTLLQGIEAGRPARLECALTVHNGRPEQCAVTGRVAPTARGTLADTAQPTT